MLQYSGEVNAVMVVMVDTWSKLLLTPQKYCFVYDVLLRGPLQCVQTKCLQTAWDQLAETDSQTCTCLEHEWDSIPREQSGTFWNPILEEMYFIVNLYLKTQSTNVIHRRTYLYIYSWVHISMYRGQCRCAHKYI